MKISTMSINKYISIKKNGQAQNLIDDSYELATEEILELVKNATKIYEGALQSSQQEIEILINSPLIFVITKYTEVVTDIILIDLGINMNTTMAYIDSTLAELDDIKGLVSTLAVENHNKNLEQQVLIDEKNNQIKALKEQIKLLEDERDVYLSNVQFNKNEVLTLVNDYKNIVRKFTGVNVQ